MRKRRLVNCQTKTKKENHNLFNKQFLNQVTNIDVQQVLR